jgi:hypothetical protein
MGLLDELLGGSRREEFQDFANRYEQGRPEEGYDDDEVARRYGELAGELDDDTYQDSARDAFERMDPDERRRFGQDLFERSRENGVEPDFEPGRDDPDSLARLTTQVRGRSPDLLGSLLGGGGGMSGALQGMLGGGGLGGGLGTVLGGGAADSGVRGGGGNPLARAVLAGITAMAARRLMDRR